MSTVQTITTMEDLRLKEKPTSKLVRTSSLERIKELNNYICSHNYYILPALMSWIRSSQNGVETNLDIAVTFCRHLMYNILLCKVIEFKLICKGCFSHSMRVLKEQMVPLAYSKITNSIFLLKSAVYVVVLVVSLEITSCFYLLLLNRPPVGLVFLTFCCLWSVVFLIYESLAEEHKGRWSLRAKSKTN